MTTLIATAYKLKSNLIEYGYCRLKTVLNKFWLYVVAGSSYLVILWQHILYNESDVYIVGYNKSSHPVKLRRRYYSLLAICKLNQLNHFIILQNVTTS